MASRVVQQVLRTARTTSKQTRVMDRKFAHPFADDGAGPANVYNSISARPTTTPPQAAQVISAPATRTGGKAFATVAPTAGAMPLKSGAWKSSMAFNESPYLKPTLENAVEHVEMLSKISQRGMKASAEQMQKILAVGAMRL